MPTPLLRRVITATALAVVALAGSAGAQGAAATAISHGLPADTPMSFLYETDDGVRSILGGSEEMRALTWIFRIEPTTSGEGARLGGGDTQRMLKVNGKALSQLPSADAMADLLRQTVDRHCPTPAYAAGTCQAHRVLVDEIGNYYGGVNGTPSAAGQRLDAAMTTLAGQATPWGGSYASRITFALAPGPSTSVAAGYGQNRTLGRNGEPIRRNYADAFRAMSKAGGVFLEAFHYLGSRMTGFTAEEWRSVPAGNVSFLQQVGGGRDPLGYVHLLFGDTARGGASCPSAAWTTPRFHANPDYAAREKQRFRTDSRVMARAAAMNAADGLTPVAPVAPYRAMDCEWQLAQGNATNLRLLGNGPAAYRLGGEAATAWGENFRAFFFRPAA